MPALLLANASLLDVVNGEMLPDRHVLVRDGRIADVSETPLVTSDAQVLNLRGKTLMPGLCDGHVHVTAAVANFPLLATWSPFYVAARAGEILNAMLMRGFTTVRDAGGADWGLAKAVEEDVIKGPRLLFCGHALSQTGGHGDMRGPGEHLFEGCFCCAGLGTVCDGVAEVRRACRHEIRKGATHLKLMVSGGVASPTDRITSTQFSEEEIRAAVEEAEAALIPVMAHAYTARAINRAIRCGVDSIEHGNLSDQSSIDLFNERGSFLVPTLATYHALAKEGVEAGMPPDLNAKVFDVLDAGIKAVELAHRGGVRMVYGTDLLGIMHRHQLNEFALRSEVVPPADMIRAATSNAAELFRMSDRIGRVETGLLADLIVVEGNPLDDLAVLQDPTRRLKLVMKEGRIYKNELA
jgi:imidazolonepropionase-like amidohydrolase